MPILIHFSINFKHSSNQAVVSRLVKEVRGLNPSFNAADVRGITMNNMAISIIIMRALEKIAEQ